MNEKLITDVMEKFGLGREEVVKEYQNIEQESRKMFSFLPEEELRKRIDFNFATFFKDLSKSDTKVFEGVIYALEPANYISRRRIEKIMQVYNESPDGKKIEIGDNAGKIQLTMWKDKLGLNELQGFVKMINDLPVAVDNIEFWNVGKPNQRKNPNYGKPLNDEDFSRTMYGTIVYEGKMTKFFAKLQGKYKNMGVPLNRAINFRMSIYKKMDDGTLQLAIRKNTKFVDINKTVEVAGLVQNLYSITPIKNIEEIVTNNRDQKIYGDLRLVKGQVLDLNLTPETGKPSFRLMEESLDLTESADVRISLPENIAETVDFGEFSTVAVLGNPWVIIDKERDSKLIGMTAYGVYSIIKTTPIDINPIQKSDIDSDEKFEEFKIGIEQDVSNTR